MSHALGAATPARMVRTRTVPHGGSWILAERSAMPAAVVGNESIGPIQPTGTTRRRTVMRGSTPNSARPRASVQATAST
jgi:hypothetical protein